MRMGAGAIKTSPISSLQILCNEPSLEVRREDLSMRYFFRCKCFIANLVHSFVVNQQLALFFSSKPNTIAPFIIRANAALASYDLPVQPVLPYRTPSIYSWTMNFPATDVSLVEDKRNIHEIRLGRAFACRFRLEYPNHSTIYTDGSKNADGVEAAAVMGDITRRMTLTIRRIGVHSRSVRTINGLQNDFREGPL